MYMGFFPPAVCPIPKRLLLPSILTNFHEKSNSFLLLFVKDSKNTECTINGNLACNSCVRYLSLSQLCLSVAPEGEITYKQSLIFLPNSRKNKKERTQRKNRFVLSFEFEKSAVCFFFLQRFTFLRQKTQRNHHLRYDIKRHYPTFE